MTATATGWLISWAIERHKRGEMSFSELAQETGLAIEEIMAAAGNTPVQELEMFLASCRALAEANSDPEFFRLSEDAIKAAKAEFAASSQSI